MPRFVFRISLVRWMRESLALDSDQDRQILDTRKCWFTNLNVARPDPAHPRRPALKHVLFIAKER
ncbi:uncharacterized protein MYCGRDRAFT_103816 [Zymoseptoria tritici IPO323]|uniref:Uncharacterized protein n=1 Tax=Zymoseptoria tritici (strain CBS 115943 / IPO323) TaxID=336722 RepID=F9X6Z9_ZYMTI|nr:uncharacterized protein MYCGRDRAFT_103816 [Zymoseptoria tritici IPO323]EGP88907.1 hypothetical protein MYCGRDRAFT_103816 [Zymoseptoria tritici IPO323]